MPSSPLPRSKSLAFRRPPLRKALPARAGRAVSIASPLLRKSSWMARTTRPEPARSPAYIRQFYTGRHVVMIYGAMRDKAIAEMTGVLFPLVNEVIATAPHQSRARRSGNHTHPGRASQRANRAGSRGGAANRPIRRPSDRVIFITGSLFLVGEALALLNG